MTISQCLILSCTVVAGKIEIGGKLMDREGFYVEPTIVTGLPHDSPIIHKETFAPIVYLIECDSFEEAIQWNNEVKQGLASSLFTQNLSNVFQVRDCRMVRIEVMSSR